MPETENRENRKKPWAGQEGEAPSMKEFKEITQSALSDFWARVAKSLPQCRSGDLSPTMTFELEIVAERAVIEWWNNNCPETDQHFKGENKS